MKFNKQSVGMLKTVIKSTPKPVLLLGAGASVKSGIPSTTEFVSKAAKWGYARSKGWPEDNVLIRRSDWLIWVKAQAWYNDSLPASENYPAVFENILHPRNARKEFLRKILNPGIPPSDGYVKLAELIGLKVFDTILTTNFDTLIDQSCAKSKLVHHHDVFKNQDELVKISTSPQHPQIIHLHGDINTYTDRNLVEEVNSLDDNLTNRLLPILRDHPLIVVGYRGAENSVMKSLFLNNLEQLEYFKHGLYWCHYNQSPVDDIPENVVILASSIGTNFQLVEIDGFDDLIAEKLYRDYQYSVGASLQKSQVFSTPEINDFTAVDDATFDDFDQIVLKSRILTYCKSLSIQTPERISTEWLKTFCQERDLAVEKEKSLVPTYAGFALFGQNPSESLTEVAIKIEIAENAQWLNTIFSKSSTEEIEQIELSIDVKGNLWEQLDEVTDLLSQFNKPFRLKADVSEDVVPYPPLALKELIVNALVHRDYSCQETIKIKIEPEYIEIINPGGLIDEVESSLGTESILEKISKGIRGIKGYRNPIIADFFYGSGAMDKAGSGLSDVYELVKQYNSSVEFGPSEDNKEFSTKIYARPEFIDNTTKTAKSNFEIKTSYVSNCLEIKVLPESVYVAEKSFRSIKKFWEENSSFFVPPFLIEGKLIYSFYPLDDASHPLSRNIDHGTLEQFSFDEFSSDSKHQNLVVKLFNSCFEGHLYSVGLIPDKHKKRAYFPKITDEDNRMYSYKARVKKATRTVAKRIVNKKTSEVLYWEHKSFSYSIKKLDNTWCIIILPGYIFTVDGIKWLVRHDKISRLATKRSSIDYNKAVLNDLFFWSYVLSNGSKSNFWLNSSKHHTDFANAKIIGLSSNYPKSSIVEINSEDVISGLPEEDLENLENEIAKAAEEEKAIPAIIDDSEE